MAFDCRDLTAKQREFCEEYVLSLNGREAEIKAGYAPGYATKLLDTPHVKAYIDYLNDERAKRLHLTQDMVLTELIAIATVDVNELVEYRRTCCRFCYGEDHRYQWTDVEFERACTEAANRGYPPPQAPGGNGYDRSKEPNPDCPECRGEGDGSVFAKDTRNLSSTARKAYAGAKVGRDGLEIKVHDKMRALEMIGKHLGMFKEKVEHSGKVDGAPVLNLLLSGDAAAKAVAAAQPQEPAPEQHPDGTDA